MGNMRFKVGDRVRIKSIDWYNENKDNYGAIYAGNGFCFWKNMVRHCGEIMKITRVKVDPEDLNKGFYFMENSDEKWTDGMIEGLVEEENNHITETIVDTVRESNDRYRIIIDSRFDIEVDEGEYYAVRGKKEYPKTYEECCKVLHYAYEQRITMIGVTRREEELFKCLIILKRCRDAYWKIAGEEMGLGEPWEPDYDSGDDKFGIICLDGVVQKSYPTTNLERHLNKILDFPTREMRDAFYENFKELIEQCKELL